MHAIFQVFEKISWDIGDTSEYQDARATAILWWLLLLLPWNRQYGFHVLKMASVKKSFKQTFKFNNILKFIKTISTHTVRIGNQAD